jgi:hypothetical protein
LLRHADASAAKRHVSGVYAVGAGRSHEQALVAGQVEKVESYLRRCEEPMSSDYLSYFVRYCACPREPLERVRTRLRLRLGNEMPYTRYGGHIYVIVGMGWEGDKFVVNVK